MAESASPPSSSVHIDLTRDEKEIFDLLLKVINHFNLATHICVAGGWVRDTLLGLPSNDIHIAIDNMTGQQFCECIPNLTWKNNCHKVQTRSVKTLGNSKDAHATYFWIDDPLRVLLAIRFGARFGFMLNEELKNAAIDEDVRTALVDKASRERIGHEIDLMISGEQANDPVQAVTYIADLNLFWDRVEDAIRTPGLEKVWEMKPLVNGKGIMVVLDIKSGAVVKEWQQRVIVWQLEHNPSGTAQVCLNWMKQKFNENKQESSSFQLDHEEQV
ncbi:hypothetical protein RND71_031775 [Anisodus tanguticus]|uniref:Poly A polymerase head domain-containing protein n=1 Tax=Anisodus tanguticus TaxID=243964 RepID=A0AAE1RCB4_9SOLA|nr:hypothetical protein RND71_031775 [Anisodus tanguticus]